MSKINLRSGLLAVVLAATLAACSSSPTKESTGEYIDDAAITTKVKTAFVQDKVVSATNVSVDTFKGVVQLSGFADNRAEIDRAVQVASQVAGVKAVRNNIALKSGGQ